MKQPGTGAVGGAGRIMQESGQRPVENRTIQSKVKGKRSGDCCKIMQDCAKLSRHCFQEMEKEVICAGLEIQVLKKNNHFYQEMNARDLPW